MSPALRSVLTYLVAIVIVFTLGWTAKGLSTKSGEERAASAVVKETAQSIVQSAVVSARVETAIQADAARVGEIKVAVRERIARNTPERIHDPDPAELQHPAGAEMVLPHDCVPHDPVLDAGTVRLLNAARAGAVQPAPVGADEERAAARPPN